ncbi:MAG: CvpA family protein [Phycisphaerales bacterium]
MAPAAPAARAPPDDDRAFRWVRAALLIGAALMLFVGLIFFEPVSKVACIIVALALIQGLWRGSAEVLGMLLGTVLAVFLAVPMAPAFEGITRGAMQLSGLAARVAAVFIAGVLILLVVGALASFLLRKLTKRSERWAKWDPLAGAALGAAEGALLALAVTWTPVALAPIARAQLAQAEVKAPMPARAKAGHSSPAAAPVARTDDGLSAARFVARAADAVERSPLSGLSEATNPVKGTRLISMSGDILEVLSSERMRAHFVESAVMREIESTPSVRRALEIIRADAELVSVLEQGADNEAVAALVGSDTVLRALDETGVIRELAALTPRIAEALEAARRSVKKTK